MTVNALKELIAGLSEGEKIHLVNHIFKHYGVFPTKLRDAVDAFERDQRAEDEFLAVGTLVVVEFEDPEVNRLEQGPAFIVEVDRADPNLTYRLQQGEESEWARERQFSVVSSIKT